MQPASLRNQLVDTYSTIPSLNLTLTPLTPVKLFNTTLSHFYATRTRKARNFVGFEQERSVLLRSGKVASSKGSENLEFHIGLGFHARVKKSQ